MRRSMDEVTCEGLEECERRVGRGLGRTRRTGGIERGAEAPATFHESLRGSGPPETCIQSRTARTGSCPQTEVTEGLYRLRSARGPSLRRRGLADCGFSRSRRARVLA